MEEKLDAIISKIKNEAKEEAEKIIKEAEEKAKEIIENGKKEAEILKNSMISKGRDQARAERQRIISSAKITAKRMVEEKKEDIINDVFKKAIEKIDSIDAKVYKDSLMKIIKESIESIGDSEVRIRVRESDVDIAREIVDKLNVKAEIVADLTSRGVVVESVDGRLIIDNRFEKIFERKMDELRIKVAKELFG